MDVVARASRSATKKRPLSPLQFTPYEMQLSGRGELRHLVNCETSGPAFCLQGQSLYCGLYLNELLYRLLPRHEPESELFQAYIAALRQLADGASHEPCLRVFELALLDAMGYGLSLQHDIAGVPLDPEQYYLYQPECGLVVADNPSSGCTLTALGKKFLAIAACNYAEADVRQLAKHLLRSVLVLYLGSKPLQSRKLFGGQ